MAQRGTEGIQILSHQEVNVSIGTLASRTALVVLSDHATALKTPFLMKKTRMLIEYLGITAGEASRIIIGMARGTVSVTQIKAALEDNLFDRTKKDQAAKRDVMHETITPVTWESFDGTAALFDTGMVSLGGGGGIPFDEDIGWQWFAWNMSGGAMTTGSTFHLLGTSWGIWL